VNSGRFQAGSHPPCRRHAGRRRRRHEEVRPRVKHSHMAGHPQDRRGHHHGGVLGVLHLHDAVQQRPARDAPCHVPGLHCGYRLPHLPGQQAQRQAQFHPVVRHRADGGGRRLVLLLRSQRLRHHHDEQPHRRAAHRVGHRGLPGAVRAVPPLRGHPNPGGGGVPAHLRHLLAQRVQLGPVQDAAVHHQPPVLLHQRHHRHAYQRVLHLHRAVHHLRRFP
jgi:hypothetical protein